jgi:hypothetical protein
VCAGGKRPEEAVRGGSDIAEWRAMKSMEYVMECACGCGGKPVKGNFLPGHDQRLRADIERRVGGLIALRMLVEAAEYFVAGDVGSSQFNGMVKDLFQNNETHQWPAGGQRPKPAIRGSISTGSSSETLWNHHLSIARGKMLSAGFWLKDWSTLHLGTSFERLTRWRLQPMHSGARTQVTARCLYLPGVGIAMISLG